MLRFKFNDLAYGNNLNLYLFSGLRKPYYRKFIKLLVNINRFNLSEILFCGDNVANCDLSGIKSDFRGAHMFSFS